MKTHALVVAERPQGAITDSEPSAVSGTSKNQDTHIGDFILLFPGGNDFLVHVSVCGSGVS